MASNFQYNQTAPIDDRNQDATIYVGNLDDKVNESILWELFLQAGPVAGIHMPKDRVTAQHQGFGFVEFLSEDDCEYAMKIMNMIKLYGKPIRVNKAATHQKNMDIGANVFIGNLDNDIDEKMLYDIFSAFGVILQAPKIMRDPDSGLSKGVAFVNYASFEASDAAIAAMNGQCIANKAITCSYAYKKDMKGEKHGSAAERMLASTNPSAINSRPNQLFSDVPADKDHPEETVGPIFPQGILMPISDGTPQGPRPILSNPFLPLGMHPLSDYSNLLHPSTDKSQQFINRPPIMPFNPHIRPSFMVPPGMRFPYPPRAPGMPYMEISNEEQYEAQNNPQMVQYLPPGMGFNPMYHQFNPYMTQNYPNMYPIRPMIDPNNPYMQYNQYPQYPNNYNQYPEDPNNYNQYPEDPNNYNQYPDNSNTQNQ